MQENKIENESPTPAEGKEETIEVVVADASHEKYVDTILKTIEEAAKVRGTGIAKRTHEYLTTKMREAKAVIALQGETFAGFSYIETWGNKPDSSCIPTFADADWPSASRT